MRMLNRDLLSETDLSPEQLNQLAVDLRQAVKECKDRGLLSAAKWYVSGYDRSIEYSWYHDQGQRASGIDTSGSTQARIARVSTTTLDGFRSGIR